MRLQYTGGVLESCTGFRASKRRGTDQAVLVTSSDTAASLSKSEKVSIKPIRSLTRLSLLVLGLALTLLIVTALQVVFRGTRTNSHPTLAGAIVINLDRDVDLWRTTINQLVASTVLMQTPAGIARLRALPASEIDLNSFIGANKLTASAYNDIVEEDRVVAGVQLTLGALGCLESHVEAWHRVIDAGAPILIFEDDVTLLKDFDAGLALALSHLPSNFGLLYLANVIGEAVKPSLTPFDVSACVYNADWAI